MSNKRTRDDPTSTISNEIKAIAVSIRDSVNGSNILDKNHTLRYEGTQVSNGISVKFSIVNDRMKVEWASATAVLDRESMNNYEKEGSEQGVYSSIGNYTGTFLFNLLLLVVIKESIPDFKLDNFTDDPARAAKGIYKRLRVDKRSVDSNDFVGQSLDKQLLVSEGKMRYIVDGDSFTDWKTDMRKLGKDLASRPDDKGLAPSAVPWNANVSENIKSFIKKLEQFGFQGGNRKPKPKRKSKRKKRTRRTRRRKRTKTRRRRKK